ncbi:glucose-6-phosphate dehydrogenase assembly protein OpcA [Candidatus Sumerlaeota bacterium]|nr:glucose-6-phosphate dehydrogenase assembly protein OpcA [Candidatus Sumerlaeota bacterium]
MRETEMSRLDGAIAINDLQAIQAVLAEMWKVASESENAKENDKKALVRVSLGNVIVVVDRERIGGLPEILDRLSVRRPCRILIAEFDEKGSDDTVRGYIRAVCHRPKPDAPQICCEHIHLQVGPESYGLLPGIVVPLLEADLPSLLWWDRKLDVDDHNFFRLAGTIGSVVFNLERNQSFEALRKLREPARSVAIHDLAWTRLEPWRRELARIFDDTSVLPILGEIREVRLGVTPDGEIRYSSSGLLFLGWLAAQLGWRIARPMEAAEGSRRTVARGPSGEVVMRLEEQHAIKSEAGETRTGPAPSLTSVVLRGAGDSEVALTLMDGTGAIAVSVKVPDSCPLPRVASGVAKSADEVIGAALESAPGIDPVYEKALDKALELVGA